MGESYSSLKSPPEQFPDSPQYDYDVYVFYADEDSDTVSKFVEYMATDRYKVTMYFRGRDPLDEFSTNLESIKTRCRRIAIFLTPNFLESPELDQMLSFVSILSADEREKLLIPVKLSPCEVPSVLSNYLQIDFTREGIQGKVWERLVVSLIPPKKLSNFVAILARCPLRMDEFPRLVEGVITEIPHVDLDVPYEEEEGPMFK